MSKHILVVEDDKDIADLLKMHLGDLGADVAIAHSGTQGLAQLENHRYDLAILDLMLPGMDGLDLCKHIRARDDYTPILMLTAKSSELDRVIGLEIGADDYLTKPFNIRELLARVKAIFRRVESLSPATDVAQNRQTLHIDELSIDASKRSVLLQGKSIELTAKEFDLLWHFAHHPGQVFTRAQLLDSIWGYGHDGYEHTVNSHINRLRTKIEQDPSNPRYILTVWGVGYKFNEHITH